MRRSFLSLASIVLLFILQSNIAGQGTTSRVTGTVLDAVGAAVPGATVTLTNEGTHVSFTTRTEDSGTYGFESIQVGTYSVLVEKPGFKKFISTGNPLNVNQPATINITLEVGGISEEVRIQSAAEIVQTSSSGNLGNTVEQRRN